MSRNILFITEQRLKDSSMLSDNIDPKVFRPTIKAVQDRYIQSILGSTLYNKLQDLIVAGPVPDGPYKDLLDFYITDALVWYTLTETPVPLQYKMVNKGVITRAGEAVQPVSFAEIQNLADYCRNWAEWYAQRCINYLCTNSNLYPEYHASNLPGDAICPDITQYTCGIDLGPVRRDKRTFDRRYQGD